jgi:thiamine-monophosphate kinase
MRPETPLEFFDGFLRGLRSAADEFRCPLAGGNLARSPGGISVSTATLGSVVPGAALLRSAARPGDEIWVTGAPGSAAAGLHALQAGASPDGGSALVRKFLDSVPRIDEAAFLRDSAGVRAAIDLSDGLRRCASLMAEESRARVVIDAAALPRDQALSAAGAAAGKDPASWALDGGEDFELLVAAPAGAVGRVRARFERKFGIPLTRIGTVETGEGLELRGDPGGEEFEHF